jgi:hypothetical protein
MKMRRTFLDKNCLSSDGASIAFADLLNSEHRSLKYAIRFLLIQTPQNTLQALKKLVLVSQVNPFELVLTVENKYKSLVARLGEYDWSGMRRMPCFSSQSVEPRLV